LRFSNPVLADPGGADHGDPFVLRHGDAYWLFHTGGDAVPVYRSPDLVRWEPAGRALSVEDAPAWAQIDLWAPEVVAVDDELLMYVAATRQGPQRDHVRRTGLARAWAPGGQFGWAPEPVVGDRWAIDAHPFCDRDGAWWLFYNTRDETTRYRDGTIGTGNVVDRLLQPERVEGRPSLVTVPDARWEGNLRGKFYWNEGPWVMRRRGRYWLTYSGGSYAEAGYAVGAASAERVRGPWVKDPLNPLLRGGRRLRGPGHNCVVLAPDGVTPYAVYHARVPGRPGRVVCLDRLWWTGERPVVAGGHRLPHRPTESAQPLPPSPVHDPGVASWHAEAWVRGRDGRLRHQARDGRDDPSAWAPEGEVIDRRVTSCLGMEEIAALGPGERRAWPWGGQQPVELSVAVRGEAIVELGDQRAELRARRGWQHVVLLSSRGAASVEVVAGRGGAEVTDLVAVAREQEWAALSSGLRQRGARWRALWGLGT
jgi:GH43 family beta-xylosidase